MSYKSLIEGQNLNFELIDKFLNTSMTSTLQEEFYTSKDEQVKTTFKIHEDLEKEHRDVYALSLLLPINDIHKQLIVKNLIKNRIDNKEQTKFENNVILDILQRMPTNRAYKTFDVLMRTKTNNVRARWLARQFLRERKNKRFEALKYNKIMRQMFKHFHISADKILKDKEIENFLFDKGRVTDELFKNYRKAKTDKEVVYKLPYSIAEGFKSLHKIPDDEFMEKIKGQLSKEERKRVQNRAEKTGIKVEVDLTSYKPVPLLKYLRAADKEIKGIKNIFEKSCRNEAERLFRYFEFENVKIILDNSGSMYGSDEKKYHPIAVAEAVAHTLKYLSDETKIISVPNEKTFLAKPDGESRIADGIMKALEDIDIEKDNLIVIISDGYENSPFVGLSNQILTIFKSKIDKKEKTMIIHINPVFAPESENIKKLSEVIQTYGIRDTKQLFLILLLAIIKNKKDKKIRQIIQDLKVKVRVRKKRRK